MYKPSKRVKALIIIGAATALVVFFDVMSSKLDTGDIKVPEKYGRIARDTSVFGKEVAKRVLLNEIDGIFS